MIICQGPPLRYCTPPSIATGVWMQWFVELYRSNPISVRCYDQKTLQGETLDIAVESVALKENTGGTLDLSSR